MNEDDPVLYEELPLQSADQKYRKPVGDTMTYLVIGAGGFVGANLRYIVGRWALQKWGTSFPVGTFIINITGCFILGLFATLSSKLAWNDYWRFLVAVGFVGAFTTFSTFEYESFELAVQGNITRAGVNIFGSLLLGLAAVFIGVSLGKVILRSFA